MVHQTEKSATVGRQKTEVIESVDQTEIESKMEGHKARVPRENCDNARRVNQLESLSHRTCQVLIPVTLCSAYVVILLDIINRPIYKSTGIVSGAWVKLGLGPEEAFSKAFVNNIIIVSAFLLLLILVTLLILFIFYMEWHGCLSFYFYVPPFIIMVVLTPTYVREVLMALNLFGIDIITVILITYNFAALGMVSIFGIGIEAPLSIQQFYLIHNSAILAILIINTLPGWAPWLLLLFLILWDLFAVLAPFGPLNLIINLAEREGMVDMPGLIYSTDVAKNEDKNSEEREQEITPKADITDTELKEIAKESAVVEVSTKEASIKAEVDKTDEQVKCAKVNGHNEEDEEEFSRGIRLGLGDFIFYGVLIGKASCVSDGVTTLSCYVSILVGLSVTLLLLATFKKPLPALPVSIALGLASYFVCSNFGCAFSQRLGYDQIFI